MVFTCSPAVLLVLLPASPEVLLTPGVVVLVVFACAPAVLLADTAPEVLVVLPGAVAVPLLGVAAVLLLGKGLEAGDGLGLGDELWSMHHHAAAVCERSNTYKDAHVRQCNRACSVDVRAWCNTTTS